MDTLLDKIRAKDRRSLAKAMSLVDRGDGAARALQDDLRRLTGAVPWWGFTGPPGVGKSTLIDALLGRLRARGRRVGVVAVDPTSPFSDGALLGDRVRMMKHAVDPEIFIRSLATHRREGGLSDATLHCARLLELAGYDPVLIETVGVGQNEVDIAAVADFSTVLLGPGYGDDIQLIKAGLLEIADLLVVNKCDLSEAQRLLKEVHAELEFNAANSAPGWLDSEVSAPVAGRRPAGRAPAIIGIEAKTGMAVDKLLELLLALDETARRPEQRAQYRRRRILGEITRGTLLYCEEALTRSLTGPAGQELVARLERGELSLEEVVSNQLSVISSRSSVVSGQQAAGRSTATSPVSDQDSDQPRTTN